MKNKFINDMYLAKAVIGASLIPHLSFVSRLSSLV
jgi:hypothetical protein